MGGLGFIYTLNVTSDGVTQGLFIVVAIGARETDNLERIETILATLRVE